MIHRFTWGDKTWWQIFMLVAVGEDVVLTVNNMQQGFWMEAQLLNEKRIVPLVERDIKGTLITYPAFGSKSSGRLAILTRDQHRILAEMEPEVVRKSKKRQRDEAQGIIRDMGEQLRAMVAGSDLPPATPVAPTVRIIKPVVPVEDRILQLIFPFEA